QTTQVGVGAPTERNAKRISSSTASWGGPNRDSLAHHYILGYERYILAVVDWIENTLYPAFFSSIFRMFYM
ncbi:hypothetical protein, partial [Staphylococcus sp. HMSC065E07]|uniref:hypothetical protein n=1 Tax=Staphylococcus sp. HMSC065E07 TaxID=1739335 RepID=UPI001C402228